MRLLPCILAAAAAANVDWESMHPSSSANTLSAAAGETVTFSWTDTHDVWLMADETHYTNCDWDGATEIGSGTFGLVYQGSIRQAGDGARKVAIKAGVPVIPANRQPTAGRTL